MMRERIFDGQRLIFKRGGSSPLSQDETMMKRRKKKRTFKPFGNPGRKLRTNVITSAPPMAIADRAPGILCSLSVCYSVCSCARLGDSGESFI